MAHLELYSPSDFCDLEMQPHEPGFVIEFTPSDFIDETCYSFSVSSTDGEDSYSYVFLDSLESIAEFLSESGDICRTLVRAGIISKDFDEKDPKFKDDLNVITFVANSDSDPSKQLIGIYLYKDSIRFLIGDEPHLVSPASVIIEIPNDKRLLLRVKNPDEIGYDPMVFEVQDDICCGKCENCNCGYSGS